MKKKSFIANLILTFMAFALCFASLFFVSCGSDADGGGEATVVVTLKNVRITGTAKVGETLTATASDTSGATGESVTGVTYQWFIANSESESFSEIPGATNRTFTITSDYVNKWIKVSATKNGSTEESEPKEIKDAAPLGSVVASGDAKVGATLTATAKDSDGNAITSDVSYQWYFSDTQSGGSAIDGAIGANYTISAIYVGKYLIVEAVKNGNRATYPTTQIQKGTLSDSYTIKNGNDDISVNPIVLTLTNGSATLPELTVEGLKDDTSTLDVSGGTATFAVASLTASKTLTITVVAPGYDSLTKDVFVTVKAEPIADGTLTLLSGEENQATILQGSVKFDLTGDNASKAGKYQFSIDSGLTWVTLTSENAEVSVGNTATSILVRVAPTGDAGIEGYIAPSESTSITIEDSNKGTKPSAGVKTVELSGDIAITQSENNLIFTADDGYTDYEWSFSEEVPTGTLTVSSDGKTATVDATKITVAGSYYLILTAKLNGHEYSGTVTIEK